MHQPHDHRTLHQRVFGRVAQQRIETTTGHVNDAADLVGQARRPVAARETFADRAIREAQAMDELQDKHGRLIEEYQAAITEIAVLRARVDDLEDHVDKVNAYWENQYEQATTRTQRITRAYAALESRFKGAMGYLATALAESKAEAYAPVQPEQVGDPPREETAEPEQTDMPMFLTSARGLPENRMTN